MSTFYRIRGSISLFLLIILLPMLTFAGLMIDISNCSLAKAAVEGAGELALNSALADYDTVLKETYGLFAVSQLGPSENGTLRERLLGHFRTALSAGGFFDTSVNSFRATAVPESSLANPGILEKGMIEFMKYRGPAEAGLSLLGSLEAFKKLGGRTDVAEKKIAVESGLRDLSGDLAEFYRAVRKLDGLRSEYVTREEALIRSITVLSDMQDKESDEYLKAYGAVEDEYFSLCLDTPSDMIEYALTLGECVKNGISGVSGANKTFADAAESYRQARGGDEDGFYLTMREESEANAARFAAGDVDEVMEQLRAGLQYLRMRRDGGLEGYMSTAGGLMAGVISETAYLKPIGGRIEVNGEVIGVPPLYLYMVSTCGEAGGDEVSEYGDGSILSENVRLIDGKARDKASVDRAFSYAAGLFDDAPSGSELVLPTAFAPDEESAGADAGDRFAGMASTVSELLSVLKEGLEDLRNNLYITEYAMGNFSCLTTGSERQTMTGVPVDPDHNRIYGCEAEYIIFGIKECEEKKFLWFTTREAAGPEANIAEAKKCIYAVRLVFNSIFALTDASIDRTTLAPALSIQAATGGFFPYRLAQLTIKLALAMAESASDLETLAGGGKVPLMKTSSTWRFSVNGMLEALKGKLTEEITQAVKNAVGDSVGFLQELADGALEKLDKGAEEIAGGLARDIGTVLDSYLRDAAGSVACIIEARTEKAFGGIFAEGGFDPAAFVDSARKEIEAHIAGYDYEIRTYLEEMWSQSGEALLQDIAGALTGAVPDPSGGLTGTILEDTLYSSVMSKISSRISSFLDGAASGITDKVRQITSAAGEEFGSMLRERGDRLSEDLSKQIAEKASDLLDRYLPVKYAEKGETGREAAAAPALDETIINFSYEDYLKLFLLLKLCGGQRDEVLLRIADVIQLNVSLRHGRGSLFRMSEAYTYVELEAEFRTRPLFPSYPLPFTKGGYHAVSGY